MAEFNLRCQMRFPKRCDLPIAEKERLEGPEKYKAFLMYQFKDNDEYLKDTIKEYFKSPLYFVYDADDVRGTGVKFCKICKLAQACDFGIGVLSPENENVFMEVGLLIGMNKPCLYVVNEKRLKCEDIRKLPFDISDQILVKYDSKDKLMRELEREVPHFIPKVQLISGYEKSVRDNVKDRLERLSPEAREKLKEFMSFGKITISSHDFRLLVNKGKEIGAVVTDLTNLKFISQIYRKIGSSYQEFYSIEETYRPFLEELLFSE